MDKIKKHKCYISYKFEDEKYRDKIVNSFAGVDFIDKSQQEEIESDDPEYIIQQIRKKWLNDSTVTIFLIGTKSGENYKEYVDIINGWDTQKIIRREITASLSLGSDNYRNGLLGVVLPEMMDKIYGDTMTCPYCGEKINIVNINNDTVIKEFGQNYYLKKHTSTNCNHYSEDDRYAVLVSYDDFMNNPEKYIEEAFQKRYSPISQNVRVRNFD